MDNLICRNNDNLSTEMLSLPVDEVHIWDASVYQEAKAGRTETLWHFLSHDERHRAERFVFQKNYEQYVVARGLLRAILSRYVGTKPTQLSFGYNAYGKPELDTVSGGADISFNLSHSGEMVLYAITRRRNVGIDIERIRPMKNAGQIVERYFSEREKAQFHTLREDVRIEAFFTCWTRKEAYIKALGGGLSIPLDQFSISFLPGEPARFIERYSNTQPEVLWTLADISPQEGYAAAAAVEGADLKFLNLKWSWN